MWLKRIEKQKSNASSTMWHEARKQERKIRGMMVDYKKRAERRREYYEKIKADPTQFLQIHGRPCKIHLDPTVAQAADTPATMMPWQGHQDNLIDRFDVRAHLDFIPEYKAPSCDNESTRVTTDDNWEERQSNYERYRTLVQNDFLLVPEEKFLYQIFLEEQFGPIGKSAEEEKKKLVDKKAAIGYTYEDSTPQTPPVEPEDDDSKRDSDSDIDLDVAVDVDELTLDQSKEMNEHALKYGMAGDDFIRLLHKDKEEAETLRLAKEAEEEKAMYSGRKSRRERRAFREKKLQGRKISPPSYAARESPTYDPYRRSKSASRSRSRSPVNCGQITYITSFGGEGSEESEGEKGAKGKRRTANSGGSTLPGPTTVAQSHPPAQPSTSHSVHSVSVNNSRSRSHVSRSRSRSHSGSRFRTRRNRRQRSYSHSPNRLQSRSRDKRYRSRSRSSSKSRSSSSRSQFSSSSRSSRSRDRSFSRSASRSRSRSWSPRRSRRKSCSRSKSVSKSSRSQSRSTSSHSSHRRVSVSKSRSKTPPSQLLPPPPRRSYYQRCIQSKNESDSSLSDESESEQQEQSIFKQAPAKNLTSLGKAGHGSKRLTPQERLKRKMQSALNRQFKADKKAEQKKMEKLEQERQDREEELREMAIKLRRRERERRHRMLEAERERAERERELSRSRSRSRSRSHSRSRSRSCSGSRSRSGSRSDSRSRSRSPVEPECPRKISRWDRKSFRRSRSRSRSPPKKY